MSSRKLKVESVLPDLRQGDGQRIVVMFNRPLSPLEIGGVKTAIEMMLK